MACAPDEPTGDELRAFAAALLAGLPDIFAEPRVVDEAVEAHRDLWAMLYRVERDGTPPRSMALPPR